jgi:hypothetical protein
MAEWDVASKLAIRRNGRVALFLDGMGCIFGGIGFATGALIASSHRLQLFPKNELPHLVATKQMAPCQKW